MPFRNTSPNCSSIIFSHWSSESTLSPTACKFKISKQRHELQPILCVNIRICWCTLWQYQLWSFKFRHTKLVRFWPKHECDQRKLQWNESTMPKMHDFQLLILKYLKKNVLLDFVSPNMKRVILFQMLSNCLYEKSFWSPVVFEL